MTALPRTLPLMLTPRADAAVSRLETHGVDRATAIELVGSFERGMHGLLAVAHLIRNASMSPDQAVDFMHRSYPQPPGPQGRL